MQSPNKQKTTGEAVVSNMRNKLRHNLSPSLPTKLADGLGLKDTPLAWRDTPRSLVPPLSLGEERLGRQLFNFLE